ncbi:glutathione S-transferase [Caballeronia fortuita]|uniref:Glutathione S-transferase n=2 Tax=Caballeronia fortuita TaxID=1777138 RepID=A0A158CTK3_9BURK|nr:glutathione S-transferase family protein [Caballeronia fortuita]SAK85561.1 glutathione S-transferase [Caballeronia fortuita]
MPDQQVQKPLKLYGMTYSGHSHRVELFLSILGLPYEKVTIDPDTEAHHKPDFLALNPFGQVPVIVDGEAVVFDSNAILVYLAKKYGDESWLPSEPVLNASVQQWFSLAAGEIAFGPCAARRLVVYGEELVPMSVAKRITTKLFETLEKRLEERQWAVGDRPTLADISAYSYIAHAPEGYISLQPYPSIRAWLSRIEALPGYVPMPKAPLRAERNEFVTN